IGLNPALANYDLSSRRSDDASSDTAAAPAAAVAVADADESAAAVAANESANENAEATDATNAADTPTVLAANDEDAAPPAPATTAMLAAADNSATTAAAAPTTPVPAAAATADLALPDTTPAPVLEVSRSRGTPQVNPDLVSAYARLQAGDIGAAGSLYRQVLAALPNNRDALLGLALVHVREGQPANARELYARLLQLNPRDPLAHTGLLQTMQGGSPVEHENALKQLQTQFPNVAQLTLALGNHYAAQGRWSEAQAAYYNALLTARRTSNGPVHPDYAFNLAVSLEQLNQPQAALDYYRQAQALAADVRPGFDLQLLNDRLDYLLLEQGPR
ncbi:MAG: tetratricopeptide repeat protein, partial [Pseudomonadota bacterium]|nr:tetratricopeptide repeat protein [Pseudomonadota bacterium]